MRKRKNKRKINKAITLERRYIKRRYRVGPFVQVTRNGKKKKEKIAKKQHTMSSVRMLSISSNKTAMVQKSI